MVFTPEDMEVARACVEGINRNVPVTVEPAAAKLLMRNTVRAPSRTSLPSQNGPPIVD
jgi:hypothetical protein